jgi:hypothetical protein
MHPRTFPLILFALSLASPACETEPPLCPEDTEWECDTDADTDADTDTDADSDADSDADTDTNPANAAPSVASIRIQGPGCESSITDSMDIVCLAAGPTSDQDGDQVWLGFDWLVDDEDAGLTSPYIDYSHTSPGEVWTCTITPFDGVDFGEPISTSVQIMGCNALSFAGGDQGVVVDALAGHELGAELTIEAWVRWDGATEAEWHTIAGQGAGDEAGPGGWAFAVSSAVSGACEGAVTQPGQVVAWVEDGPCSASTLTLDVGEWTHVAAVLDSGTWSIWIGGIPYTDIGSELLVSVVSDEVMRVGTMPSGDSPWGFVGIIDEMRLMTTVHYKGYFSPSAHPIPENGTVGLWHMDEGEGSVLGDTTVDGRDGRIEGAAWSTESSCDAVSGTEPPRCR